MDATERRLVSFAQSLAFDDLNREVLDAIKQRFIDAIGCALGAFDAEPAAIARKIALRVQTPAGSGVIGTCEKSSPELAAFANTAMIRLLDFNDDYFGKDGPHPSDTMGAILAVADAVGATGKEFITAVAVAYETLCGLADAVGLRDLGWDYVTFTGAAAALGAGKLLGLSDEHMRNALSLAIVPNCTLGQTRLGELSMWKGLASANACRNGVFAALLAKEGITGPENCFEGGNGVFKQVSGSLDLSRFGAQPLRASVVYLKSWPVFYTAQLPVETALVLREKVSVEEIDSVTVESYRRILGRGAADREKWRPSSRETADHSLPFCVAAALLDGDISLGTFESNRFLDRDAIELMSRVELREDPDFTRQYPDVWNCRITAVTRSGERHVAQVTFPKGHPKKPMTVGEVEAKFSRLAEGILPATRCADFLDFARDLEEAKDIGKIFELLSK
ncbi:MAG TPA: MmgE/PrpD family protein [Candidatus Binatia bacterium]